MSVKQSVVLLGTDAFNARIFDLGGDDYRHGLFECDNPFRFAELPEEHKLWLSGFRAEKKRYRQNNENGFDIGDKVQWIFSNRGVIYTRQGIVAAVIPPRRDFVVTIAGRLNLYKRHKCSEKYPKGLPRPRESYAVLVFSGNKARKNKLFWPKTSLLKKIN